MVTLKKATISLVLDKFIMMTTDCKGPIGIPILQKTEKALK